MGRLLNLPTVKRYMDNGCDGTKKDRLIAVDEAIEGHESFIRGVEFRVEHRGLDPDEGFEQIAKVSGKINRLWEEAMDMIPTSYFPFAPLLNP